MLAEALHSGKQIHNQKKDLLQKGQSILSTKEVGQWRQPGHQVTLGNGVLSGAQCWSRVLADLELSSNFSQVSFGE